MFYIINNIDRRIPVLVTIWNRRGVTLIEFVIILIIIVILTVIAVPTFITFYKTHRLKSTTEALYYALQFARTEAVKRNTTVYVSFTTGDSWCFGVNPGSSCNCGTAGSCTLLTVSAPQAQQISLSQSGYNSNYVYFEGTHGAANASGSLTYTLFGQTPLVKIKLGAMGNLQMCSTGVSGYTAC